MADEVPAAVTASNEAGLQVGTGGLLRAISAAAVDAANRAGDFDGRIVVVQSTSTGLAAAINRQHGRFTLLERGVENGEPVERSQQIESIYRALVAERDWDAIREVACRPELRVIVSNVTEAGFRLDDTEPPPAHSGSRAPASFPAKVTDLLHQRFRRLADGPELFVIPTELVSDNGPRLAAMVDSLAKHYADAASFREWISRRVRFCSSLVDRITTGPSADAPDPLTTVTELHSLWAIEGDPIELREAFPIDAASNGAVVFAPDIAFYRERKLRLLNGAHTALAPMAMMAGIRTVREAVAHGKVGPFLRRILFDEIVPSTALTVAEGTSYAQSVMDRFANPWLDHEWRVILTNQTAKFGVRVVPSIVEFAAKFGRNPGGLIWSLAATLRYVRTVGTGSPAADEGWWRGTSYRIVDVDHELIDRHWRAIDAAALPSAISPDVLARFAARALGDSSIWGRELSALPGIVDEVTQALVGMESPSRQ